MPENAIKQNGFTARIFNEAFGKNLQTVVIILMCTGKNLRGPQLTWLSSSYHCLGDTVSCRTQCTTSYYFLCWLCSMKPLGKDLPAVDSLSQEIDRWMRNRGIVTIMHFHKPTMQLKRDFILTFLAFCIYFLLLQLYQHQLNEQIQLVIMLKQMFVVPWVKRDSMAIRT